MGFFMLLEAIDKALDNTAYRRKLLVRAIEDFLILFRLGLEIAAICAVALLILRFIGME